MQQYRQPNRSHFHEESAEGKAILDMMARTPLLSREEESALAADIARLRNLIEAVEETIQATEETEIVKEYHRQLTTLKVEYQHQFDHLFYANIRMVIDIVGKMSRMEYMDMFQHGCMGLMRAIQKFDLSYGVVFSTYATRWIKQAIQRGCDKEDSLIAIPTHARTMWKRVQRNSEPDADLESLSETCERLDVSYNTVVSIRSIITTPVSLDVSPMDGISPLRDRIPDHTRNPIRYIVEYDRQSEVVSVIRRGLSQLAEVTDEKGRHPYELHAQVMRLRYRIGEELNGKTKRNLDEVGRMVVSEAYPNGITGDHARQLQRVGAQWMISNIPELSTLMGND